jgi:hypothetical protein
VRRSKLGEHVAVVAQRGRLAAALVLQVLQPLRRQLAECRTTLTALALPRFDRALLPVVLGEIELHDADLLQTGHGAIPPPAFDGIA